jgi:cytidylate kinase
VPIITVSRMYGSGGSNVAAAVARELGWRLLDNAMIDAVAERTGLTTSEVAAREERQPSLAERLVDAMAMSTQEPLPLANVKLPPTDERLLEVTRVVIEEAAAQGPVVIVGRGAQEMLGSRDDLMAVFCYAPKKALVARTMMRDGLDEAAAAKRVGEVNRQRAEWVRAQWGRSWDTVEHYHLCVNTALLGVDGAARLIAEAARQRFGGDVLADSAGVPG